jgi:hypothetical protein
MIANESMQFSHVSLFIPVQGNKECQLGMTCRLRALVKKGTSDQPEITLGIVWLG